MVKAGGNGLWNGSDNGGFLTVDSPLFKVLHTGGPSLIGIEMSTSGPFAHNNQPTLYSANGFLILRNPPLHTLRCKCTWKATTGTP